MRVEVTSPTYSTRAAIDVPGSWTATAEVAGARVVFVEPGRFAGGPFLPNVTLRLDAADSSEDVAPGALVLSDEVVEGPSRTRRVRVLVSDLDGETLVQQVVTIQSADALLSVVASAAESQWAALAEDFDSVTASSELESV